MQSRRTKRWSTIAAAVVVVLAAGFLSGCPDGSLLGLVGENGESDGNANLSALTVSQGELYPPFNPATTEYEVSLASGISSIVITGTAAVAGAGVSDNSGTSQTLESGANQITITVTAGDGTTTKAYVLTVNRGAIGVLDSTFDPGLGANGRVHTVAIQSDGKVLIGGDFTSVDGTPRNRIARLNADGTLDTTFDPGAGASAVVEALVVQSDGKIVVGGDFEQVDGLFANRIVRLNADGSVDSGFSFNSGGGADGTVMAIAVQTDGKILLGGGFSGINAWTSSRIARLNTDGSFDTSFDVGSGASSSVESIAVGPDGRIVIGGHFWSVDGLSRSVVARLTSDGGVDTLFSSPGFESGADSPATYALAAMDDGRVVIGGAHLWIPDVYYVHIAQLSANGSPIVSFSPSIGTGYDTDVRSVVVQNDSKILVAGRFSEVDGYPLQNVARLYADGTPDLGFALAAGANGSVQTLAVQHDGKLLIAGDFTSFDGTPCYRIARLK